MSIILLLICSVQYLVSFWVSITNRSIEKLSTYECGQEPFGNSRIKFDILYYIIGIQYLIFDLELIFQFPLATVIFTQNSIIAMWTGLIFQTILTIGFIFEYKKGAQDI